jgi:ubiquinol oxidase
MPRILRKPLSLAAAVAAAAAALALFGRSGLTAQVEAAFAGSHPAACISAGGAASGTRRTGLARPWQLGAVSPSSSTPKASLSSKIRFPEVSAGGLDDDDDDPNDTDEDCLFPLDVGQLQSPALVRGSPLEESDKSRNRELVRAIKTFLFDTLFGGPQDRVSGDTTAAAIMPSSSAAAMSTTTPMKQQQQQAAAAASADDLGDVIRMSYRRFHALETIARTPYFAYVSALHLLETVGQWRQADYLKLHFCEAWNELHHLLILEELLGGTVPFRDRFVAQHVAVGYYWFAVAVYMVNPALAYNLNQAVEEEAYETYQGFLGRHGPYLKSQPAPDVAKKYYAGEDLYLFDSMHHRGGGAVADATTIAPRRPTCETLYDTFRNIRDDEMEHVKTMAYLQGDCQHD